MPAMIHSFDRLPLRPPEPLPVVPGNPLKTMPSYLAKNYRHQHPPKAGLQDFLIDAYPADIDPCDGSPVPVDVCGFYLNGFLENQIRSELLRPGPESLSFFRTVDSIEPDPDFFFSVFEDRNRVSVLDPGTLPGPGQNGKY